MLPKKKRGFRTITVNNKHFNWRFAGVVEVRPALQKNNKLVLDFGWFEEWLYMNDRDNRPPAFSPRLISPAFVSRIISFALENNWDIQKKAAQLRLVYKNECFQIVS